MYKLICKPARFLKPRRFIGIPTFWQELINYSGFNIGLVTYQEYKPGFEFPSLTVYD